MNQEEIKKLAIECGAHVHENGAGFNYEELAAYTAAVEAKLLRKLSNQQQGSGNQYP